MRRIAIALSAFFCLFVGPALADGIVVSEAWTRATAPGQKVAGVYFDIASDRNARLVGVETTLTDAAELHLMTMDDGVMRMRAVSEVDLPAGKTVKFKPGGYHVMLFDLRQPLEAGAQVALELLVEYEDGEQTKLPVMANVRNLDGSKIDHHH
jgi:copper(I)-binding protein